MSVKQLMATIISLKEKEKLAILKIMVEINNHYSERLPKAFRVMKKTACFFNLPNGISIAYDMPISDAQKILKTVVHQHDKHEFFTQLLAYMLRTSEYGVYKKIDKMEDETIDMSYNEYIKYIEGEEYARITELLQIEFQEEWSYVFNLLENIIHWTTTSALAGFLMFWPESPLNRTNWIIVDENDNVSNSKTTKDKGIKPIVNQQTSVKKEKQIISHTYSDMENKQFSNNKSTTPYSSVAKEKIAILRIMVELNNRYNLPKGVEFIQDTANYLGVHKAMSKVNHMPLSEAQDILKEDSINNFSKHCFINDLFSYYLRNEELGTNAQKRQFIDAISIIGKKFHFSYGQTTSNPLTSSHYRLIKDNNLSTFSITLIEDNQNEDIKNYPKQVSEGTDVQNNVYKHSKINNIQCSQNDKMIFSSLDKKEVILAMKFMIEADNINHPSEKTLFDCVYSSLDISNEEGLSIMNYFKDAQNDMVISLKNHLSTISSWTLDKKKNLISILTVMATIDKNIDERESKLLTQYRITCGLSYEDYSMLEAMQDAKKYIIK